MLSRLLSGGFIGVILTLALAYFGHTNDAYVMALKELGKKRKDTDVQVKDFLVALHSLGMGFGFFIRTGESAHIIPCQYVTAYHITPFILLNPQE